MLIRDLRDDWRHRPLMDSPAAFRDWDHPRWSHLEYEVFLVVFLDVNHRLIDVEAMFRGTLTQTSVYPREVIKSVLARNAPAVALSHNHPSGLAQPSRADEALTQTLKAALALVDIRCVDHFIVAGDDLLSMVERGSNWAKIQPPCFSGRPVRPGDSLPASSAGAPIKKPAPGARHRRAVRSARRASPEPSPHEEHSMHTISAAHLRELAEPLAVLSLLHLTPATRQKLLDNDLSVNAYPTDHGGFIFVGAPRHRFPVENDLASIFEAAEQAGVIWLFFDVEAPIVDDIPVFAAVQPTG